MKVGSIKERVKSTKVTFKYRYRYRYIGSIQCAKEREKRRKAEVMAFCAGTQEGRLTPGNTGWDQGQWQKSLELG